LTNPTGFDVVGELVQFVLGEIAKQSVLARVIF
jgi:hypothetical protein